MQQALSAWRLHKYLGLYGVLLINGGPTMTAVMGALVAANILNFITILAVATAADLTGDSLWYIGGRLFGPRLVRSRMGRFFRLNEERIDRFERHIQRHGGRVLLTGKFTEVIDFACIAAAGIAKMSCGRFFFWDTLASLLKSLTFMAVGFFFLRAYLAVDGWPLHAAIIALAISTYIAFLVVSNRRSATTQGGKRND